MLFYVQLAPCPVTYCNPDLWYFQWYLEDSFGLKTLDQRGSLYTYEVPGIIHKDWHTNFTIFSHYIAKWLD